MAGRLSAIDLASAGIDASIMSTVLMTLISVLLALPPIITQPCGAGRRMEVGREIHQSVWISLAEHAGQFYIHGTSHPAPISGSILRMRLIRQSISSCPACAPMRQTRIPVAIQFDSRQSG